MRLLSAFSALSALSALSILSAALLHAQGGWEGMSPAERQEIVAYRLSMADINKMAAAGAKLEALKKDPKMKSVMEHEEATSLTDAVAKMNAAPPVRSAIESSGLTAKQFMVTAISLASTRAAVKLQAMGGDAVKAVALMPTSPQNLQFYAAHQAEIEPIAKQLEESGGDSE